MKPQKIPWLHLDHVGQIIIWIVLSFFAMIGGLTEQDQQPPRCLCVFCTSIASLGSLSARDSTASSRSSASISSSGSKARKAATCFCFMSNENGEMPRRRADQTSLDACLLSSTRLKSPSPMLAKPLQQVLHLGRRQLAIHRVQAVHVQLSQVQGTLGCTCLSANGRLDLIPMPCEDRGAGKRSRRLAFSTSTSMSSALACHSKAMQGNQW